MTSGQASNLPRVPPSSWRSPLWLLGLLLVFLYLAQVGQEADRQTLSYSAFKARVAAGEVVSVTIQGDRVAGKLKAMAPVDPEAGPAPGFVTTLPPVSDPDLLPLLDRHGVEVQARSTQSSWWAEAIIGLLPWLLILGFVWYASRKMQEGLASAGRGGLFGFAKSRAKRFSRGQSAVSFADVAGLDNAKRDLREITSYLQAPERFRRLGAKIPKGVLLMGPPGTGKTLLAKAVAGEASVPFFSISGSEFIEMFVGVGASRVRDMFESAKKAAPSIIFIDEIDSVGRARGTGLGGGHDEREQTLNQILNEMDGFAPHETVVVLAATNRPDVLDPALLRPGRFDRKVVLDLPDRKARRAILAIHAREVPLADDADLDRLAALTVGLSGAELENLVNEAALLAGRDEMVQVDMRCLLSARDKIVLGGPREMVVGNAQKRLTACHEAGHAIAASYLPQADPLDKVTIVPRGRALGATAQVPEEDRYSLRESYLRDRIGVMLAGRVAERLVYGEVSSGTEQDLRQATRLARHMVTQWGMSSELGPVAFSRGEEHIFLGREMVQQREFSEHTARLIDDEMRRLVGEIEANVRELLESHRPALEALADALFESETLGAPEIKSIIEQAGEEREDAERDTATTEV